MHERGVCLFTQLERVCLANRLRSPKSRLGRRRRAHDRWVGLLADKRLGGLRTADPLELFWGQAAAGVPQDVVDEGRYVIGVEEVWQFRLPHHTWIRNAPPETSFDSVDGTDCLRPLVLWPMLTGQQSVHSPLGTLSIQVGIWVRHTGLRRR